jgi:hypothetical protein
LLAMLIGGVYLYQSPSHDFRCDVSKRLERGQAGKDYWCLW